MAEANGKIFGMIAEFESATALLEAARKVRSEGYTKFDCHSPFPIHGMDKAMGLGRSPLGFIVGIAAFAGLGFMTWLTWYASAVDYPLVISGKPYFSYQAYVPVVFAMSILFAALSATLGMFHLNKLPMLFHPLFNSDHFKKVTDDGFFVSIESRDKKFDEQQTRSFLESIGGSNVEVIGE
jgi:hypothetical protein